MPHQPVIDGFEFASAGAAQQGVMPVSGFQRLSDVLASDAGELAYTLHGVGDARGRPSLRLRVKGALQLRCQRCLDGMAFEANVDTLLVLAVSQAEIDADPADAQAPDRLLAGKKLKVRDIVEDELLLVVPYAPKHERCQERPGKGAGLTTLPFAGLKGLIDGKH